MPDKFDPDKRRQIMAAVKSKNSRAELLVFQYLRKQGIYFQRHYARVPGKPDIALPRKKKAVFIDGDFWHGRNLEQTLSRLPKVYWHDKILRNVERDKVVRQSLENEGWTILQSWEGDILRKSTQQEELAKIAIFLKSDSVN